MKTELILPKKSPPTIQYPCLGLQEDEVTLALNEGKGVVLTGSSRGELIELIRWTKWDGKITLFND